MPQLKDLRGDLKLEVLVGKDVTCEDGITRHCTAIGHSEDFKYVRINGTDTEIGHSAHILRALSEINGTVPSDEELSLFNSISDSFAIEWEAKQPTPKGKLCLPKKEKKQKVSWLTKFKQSNQK